MMQQKECTKSRLEVRLQASWGPFLADHVEEPNHTQLIRSSASPPGTPNYQDEQHLTNETLHTESECRE